jgi:hypothetical protein
MSEETTTPRTPAKRCGEASGSISARTGKPCSAYSLPSDPLGRCSGHSGRYVAQLDSVRAAKRSAEVRRARAERRKLGSLGLAEKLVQEQAELIIGVFIEAIKKGDWRAAEALLQRVYGKPAEKVEVSQPQSVEEVEQMSLAEIRQLRAVTERDSSD